MAIRAFIIFLILSVSATTVGVGSETLPNIQNKFEYDGSLRHADFADVSLGGISSRTVHDPVRETQWLNRLNMLIVRSIAHNKTAISSLNKQRVSAEGTLVVQRPPANTMIDHKLTINFNTPIQDETIVLFNQAYDTEAISINSYSAQSGTNNLTANVVTVNNENNQNNSTQLTGIRLQVDGNATIETTVIDMQVRHPDVSKRKQYQLKISNKTVSKAESIVRYQVRPIGSDRRSGLTGEFDRTDGAGFVYANATVYQGERDIEFRGTLTNSLIGVEGSHEGTLLEPPIPTDKSTGVYSVDGENNTASVRVSEPKITTLRLENQLGADVTNGRIDPQKTEEVLVIGQSNFETAEEIEIMVTNSDGIDITDELIDTDRTRTETSDGTPISLQSFQTQLDSKQEPHLSPFKNNSASADDNQSLGCHVPACQQMTHEVDNRCVVTAPKKCNTTSVRSNEPYNMMKFITQNANQRSPDGVLPQTRLNASDTVTTKSPERIVEQTNIQPGDTTTVTVRAVVGSDGELTLAETITPDVSTNITSVDIGTLSKEPFIAASSNTGIIVSVRNVPTGTPINVTYEVQTPLTPETYQITGVVRTDDRRFDTGQSEIIVGSRGSQSSVTTGGQVRWQIDTDEIETSAATVTLTGSDDLDTGAARSTADLRLSRNSVSLSPASTRLDRGENTNIKIQNGIYGQEYIIGVDVSDIKSNIDTSNYYSIFRNVGTTESTGVLTEDGDIFTNDDQIPGDPAVIFARVRVDPDDGAGVTQLRSDNLAETATVELLKNDSVVTDFQTVGSIADETELIVDDPTATLSEPDEYIPRSEVTLRGSVAGTDAIVMYVESNSGFKLIDLSGQSDGKYTGTSVSGNEFSHETTLSAGSVAGNQLFSLPGKYRVALVPKSSVSLKDGTIPKQLSQPTVVSETTSLHTIRVRDPTIRISRPGVSGVIADTEEVIKLNGTISGPDAVLIVAIGDRGSVESQIVDQSNFTDVTFPVESFSRGTLTVYAITPGRDGTIGDGQIPGETTPGSNKSVSVESQLQSLQAYINSVSERRGYTGKRIQAVIRNETNLDTASDDVIAKRTAQIAQARININSPKRNATLPAGESINITGKTNISPLRTKLYITISRNEQSIRSVVLDDWSRIWSLKLRDEDVTTGEYRISVSARSVSTERRMTIISNQTATSASSASSLTMTTAAGDANSDSGETVQTSNNELSTAKTDEAESGSYKTGDKTGENETVADGEDAGTKSVETTTPGFVITHAICALLVVLYLRVR